MQEVGGGCCRRVGLPGLTPFAPRCFACFVSNQPAVRPTCPCPLLLAPSWDTGGGDALRTETHRDTQWYTLCTGTQTVARSQQLFCHLHTTQAPFWDTKGLHFVEKQLHFAKRTQDRRILKRPKCAHRQLSFVDSQLHICSLMLLAHVPQLGDRLPSYT